MKYKIKIYPSAEQDLKDIVTYLNTLSPQAALHYYNKLTTGITNLSNMPARCPLAKDLALRAKGYRFLIVDSYIVFFVIVLDTVQIRRILYKKRNYLDILQ